jgi:hypothetical protein
VELLLRHVPDQQVLHTTVSVNALMVACKSGKSADCVELLLRHVPDQQVLVVNSSGGNALMLACQSGKSDCVELLLRHSPDEQVLVVNSSGGNALTLACDFGSSDCVELLLRHSPDEQMNVERLNAITFCPEIEKLLRRRRAPEPLVMTESLLERTRPHMDWYGHHTIIPEACCLEESLAGNGDSLWTWLS